MIECRVQLASQISKFETQSPIEPAILAEMRIPPPSDKDDDDADEFSDYEAEDDEDTDSDWQEVEHDDFAWEAAETMPLQLPSRLDVMVLKAHGLEDLLLQEKELREGHMNDALRALRNSLGDKAFLL